MKQHFPFKLEPLKYDYTALEPYIDAQTMQLHHNKHLSTYIGNLNNTLEPYTTFHNWTLEELITNTCRLPKQIQSAVINNAGGVYNHELYFSLLKKDIRLKATSNLSLQINRQFGSFDKFYEYFKTAALNQFGSGYVWLVINLTNKLEIISTSNQNAPLMLGLYPLILVDVWEHAYYLKYKNKRIDYLDNFKNVLDFEYISTKYDNCLKNMYGPY